MVPTIFFFLQFSSLLYLFTASFASTEEATALLKWKATFHNQNNSLLAPWTLITDAFRDWYGIICFNSWINRLNIANASVTGDLTKLKRLYLHSNQFSGPISGELGNLKNLTGMDLARNQFSGSIPITLGDLIKLKRLYLSSNQLFDPIPSELGNSKNLTILELVANQLTLDDDLIDNDLNDYKNDGNHPINMEDDSMHMEDFSSNSQDDAEDCGTESQPGHSFTDGTNFYYGQTFANKKELKMLLDTIVTRQSFDYYMEKSCTKLIKAKYLSRGCGWLFRAKKYDTLQKNLSW
ncbi:MDIS1-interacting receptor like kinase 2-like [Capsicum annuum]|uniref:MDIS1-interacting receptor like kinase 2-like n=1 Tax=Capsicum annuum TaxID=4072 RepID=UPI001FB0A3A0|nr:MDIS1-interacting receptor like kinase 2-like [Capsicum annuum]